MKDDFKSPLTEAVSPRQRKKDHYSKPEEVKRTIPVGQPRRVDPRSMSPQERDDKLKVHAEQLKGALVAGEYTTAELLANRILLLIKLNKGPDDE
mgnify:FL=1